MILVLIDTPRIHIKRALTVFGFDDDSHGHANIVFENVQVPSMGQLSTLPTSQYAHNPSLSSFPLGPCSSGYPAENNNCSIIDYNNVAKNRWRVKEETELWFCCFYEQSILSGNKGWNVSGHCLWVWTKNWENHLGCNFALPISTHQVSY